MAILKFLFVSETGSVRNDNQDSFYVSEDGSVFCVADGMGGGKDGALASSIVCEEVKSALRDASRGIRCAIDRAIAIANRRVREHARDNGYEQMGSTVVVLAFDDGDTGMARICNVGDSRVYRIRNDKACLLTDDHTLANQILRSGEGMWSDLLKGRCNALSHILTKAVGTAETVHPDWTDAEVKAGDRFLVCSDGVHDVVDEDKISQLSAISGPMEEFSRLLKSEICRCGSPDNFTYIIVECGGKT